MTSERRILEVDAQTKVSAWACRPSEPRAWLLLAHGAGAGMDHPFMEGLATALHDCGIATLRYNFPYMDRGRKLPDKQPALIATVRAAIDHARPLAGELPVFAGGKSMGSRMTSLAMSEPRTTDSDIRGLVFFGFPLQAPGKTGTERALHLAQLQLPLLFIQGTRDKMAPLPILETVLETLEAPVRLHRVEGADHGFAVLKRLGLSQAQVLDAMATTVADWIDDVVKPTKIAKL